MPEDERPHFKDVTYYFQYIIFPVISGLMGYAYFDESQHINRMPAIQIGASSPLLFKTLQMLSRQILPKNSKHYDQELTGALLRYSRPS